MGNGSPSPPPPQAGAADLLGGMGAGPAAPPAGAPAPQWTLLCMRNDGVLFEDATIQIGVKMEFQGHQGRLGLFFGNKTQFPLMYASPQRVPGKRGVLWGFGDRTRSVTSRLYRSLAQ
eukprot:scaffold183272_cov30-Tisochrysis_lutea.AAC.1